MAAVAGWEGYVALVLHPNAASLLRQQKIGASFASKLTLAYNSFVTFGGALDPIRKLAAALRQLLGYYVASADCTAVYDVRCQRDSLAHLKFMLSH
jgi:hypothetical protein